MYVLEDYGFNPDIKGRKGLWSGDVVKKPNVTLVR